MEKESIRFSKIYEIDGSVLKGLEMDDIKMGLIGTSDEKNNWFNFNLQNLKLNLAFDESDNDILHIQIIGGLANEAANNLKIIGTSN